MSDEFVIIGNDVLLKCSVPGFALDLVTLNGWVTNEGFEIVANSNNNGNFILKQFLGWVKILTKTM